jgi:hypothetical protein
MAKKKIETGLYTDQRGRVTCKEHAPLEGSDTWVCDQWKPMKPSDAARFEKEIGRAPACETCALDAGWVEVKAPDATGTPDADPTPTEAPAPETKPRKSKKAKPTGDATLEQACAGYLANLEAIGKSQGTLFSYKLELVVAMDELGAKTPLAEITSDRVIAFFGSDRVMRTRTGVEKAPPTYLKTRRVLRQALVWAAEAGLIEKAPLPEDAATY